MTTFAPPTSAEIVADFPSECRQPTDASVVVPPRLSASSFHLSRKDVSLLASATVDSTAETMVPAFSSMSSHTPLASPPPSVKE